MANIKEKVAYLQGLTTGLNVNDKSAEGKLLLNIVDVLEEIADEFGDMHTVQQDLENYVETIDEDLNDLEEEVYEDEPGGEDMIEVECPNCHEKVTFAADIMNDDDYIEVTCPYCGEIVYDTSLTYDNDNQIVAEETDDRLDYGLNHPGI